jgi:translation initiation factor 5B
MFCGSVIAGKGILSSAIATGVLAFATIILFLFCTPDLNTLFSLAAPQPFVQMYAMALGRGGSIVMNTIAVIGLIVVGYAMFSLIKHCSCSYSSPQASPL